ncbi:MAG: TIGR02452 family protein [Eggerthellaceae bacterium]|nr:TIGR02452 family protein [Eggerthellaceae bacterium]
MAMAMSLDTKVLAETEGAIVRGEYSRPEGPRKFLASRGVQEDVDYYPADEVEELIGQADEKLADKVGDGCEISVKELDALVAALEIQAARDAAGDADEKPVLVLNFANGYAAGANALIGKYAQEGELCRRSTVYASITATEAHPFYDANKEVGSNLYTNGLLVSPHVEVFREVGYLTMETPVVVSVISSPAPYAEALEAMTEEESHDLLTTRIKGILALAAREGYKHLVLGAWGCGTNCNDPAVIARAFHDALRTPIANATYADLFKTVTFAILDLGAASNFAPFRAEFE